MRHSPALATAATTAAALTAGLTAAVVLSRRAARRLPATTTVPDVSLPPAVSPAPAAFLTPADSPASAAVDDGVVLPFLRPVATAPVAVQPAQPVQPVRPARCGDSGGETKSGAPCAARATTGGRCHHHRLAA